MPGSVQEGKQELKDFCIKNNVRTVLDIGPGEATYFYTLRDLDLEQLDGIEVWGPYVGQYDLLNKYSRIFVGDAYYFDWDKLPQYDMVLLGDVIEHMPEYQGRYVIAKAAEHGKWVTVSLPIYGYAQHVTPAEGNWFETHVEQYSDASIKRVLEPYEILEEMQGEVVGVYIFRKRT